MRSRLARIAAAVLIAASVGGPTKAAPDPYSGYVNEHAYVPTIYGDIYVQYWRPLRGRVPVIVQMSPYRYLYARANPTSEITDFYSDRYLPRGYGAAFADLLGTGLSGGCYDYGGMAEARAGYEVVEWLARQPWSTGKIGMIGTSYDGAIQVETAALAPPHLAAIVPQEPVTSWYGYNYDHAVSHMSDDEQQGGYPVGTPDVFDLVLGRTINTDPDRSIDDRRRNLAERTDECGTVEHNVRGHLVDPTYGQFWVERDWARRAQRIRAAVLWQHGWRDMNTKPDQFWRAWPRLLASNSPDVRALVGQWQHTDVFASAPSGVDFPVEPAAYLDAFFDRWLLGKDPELLRKTPKVLSEDRDGVFRTTLPVGIEPTVTWLDHGASPGKLVATAGAARGTGAFTNTGLESSAVFKADPLNELGTTLAYLGEPFARPMRLVGSGRVVVYGTSSGTRGHLDATLFDIAPDGSAQVITLGLSDLRFRLNLSSPSALTPGSMFVAGITLRPQDHVIAKGHRVGLVLAGSESVWGISDPAVGQALEITPASRLELPLVRP
jgi:X-Pro dipeptidyl-peptidase